MIRMRNIRNYAGSCMVNGEKWLFQANEIKEVPDYFRGKHNGVLQYIPEEIRNPEQHQLLISTVSLNDIDKILEMDEKLKSVSVPASIQIAVNRLSDPEPTRVLEPVVETKKEKRKYTMSEEQREAARVRMAAAREKRMQMLKQGETIESETTEETTEE
jgi:dsDNA-binding SOS-regulon protein